LHELGSRLSVPITNQHLSAIRQWLEWLALECAASVYSATGRGINEIARLR